MAAKKPKTSPDKPKKDPKHTPPNQPARLPVIPPQLNGQDTLVSALHSAQGWLNHLAIEYAVAPVPSWNDLRWVESTELWSTTNGKNFLLAIHERLPNELPCDHFGNITGFAYKAIGDFVLSQTDDPSWKSSLRERIERVREIAETISFETWMGFHSTRINSTKEETRGLWYYAENFMDDGIGSERFVQLLRQLWAGGNTAVRSSYIAFFRNFRDALADPYAEPWTDYQSMNANCGRSLNSQDQTDLEIRTRGWQERRDRAVNLSAAFDSFIASLAPEVYSNVPTLMQRINEYRATLTDGEEWTETNDSRFSADFTAKTKSLQTDVEALIRRDGIQRAVELLREEQGRANGGIGETWPGIFVFELSSIFSKSQLMEQANWRRALMDAIVHHSTGLLDGHLHEINEWRHELKPKRFWEQCKRFVNDTGIPTEFKNANGGTIPGTRGGMPASERKLYDPLRLEPKRAERARELDEFIARIEARRVMISNPSPPFEANPAPQSKALNSSNKSKKSNRTRWPSLMREHAIDFFYRTHRSSQTEAFYQKWIRVLPTSYHHPKDGIAKFGTWKTWISHSERPDMPKINQKS